LNLTQRIEHTIEPSLTNEGYAIVRISFSSTSPKKVLQIMIERLDEAALTLDDCVKVHHLVSTMLDVHNFIEDHYHLEISSAGLDRPLVTPKDFKRFIQKNAVIHTVFPINNVKKILGEIVMVDESYVKIKPSPSLDHKTQEEIEIPFSSIRRAHLAIVL
jgi:ribosome maturation factor RimP